MKTVKTLDKRKCRNSMWRDNGGDLWYYSIKDDSWCVLLGYATEPVGVASRIVLMPSEWHGPFQRVLKFDRA